MPPSSSFCSSCCAAMAHAAGSCAAACSASSFASALADASSMLRSHVCCGVGSVVAKLGGAFSLLERMKMCPSRCRRGSSEAGPEKSSHRKVPARPGDSGFAHFQFSSTCAFSVVFPAVATPLRACHLTPRPALGAPLAIPPFVLQFQFAVLDPTHACSRCHTHTYTHRQPELRTPSAGATCVAFRRGTHAPPPL